MRRTDNTSRANSNMAVGFGLIVLLALAGAYLVIRDPPRRNHSAIIDDSSISTKLGCGCIKSIGERALADHRLGPGSSLTYFAIGTSASSNEPLLLEKYSVPDSRRVLEGKKVEVQRQQKILASLQQRCEQVTPTEESPIFFAIKRVVEHLRSAGCSQDSDCMIYVQTDGEETADTQIKAAIDGAPLKRLKLPDPIQNAGIRIIFVGLAEKNSRSASGRNRRSAQSQRSDRLQQVWRSLFTDPGRVSFEPFCGDAETAVTATSNPIARAR